MLACPICLAGTNLPWVVWKYYCYSWEEYPNTITHVVPFHPWIILYTLVTDKSIILCQLHMTLLTECVHCGNIYDACNDTSPHAPRQIRKTTRRHNAYMYTATSDPTSIAKDTWNPCTDRQLVSGVLLLQSTALRQFHPLNI